MSAADRFRLAYREQRTLLWIGARRDGVAVWIRLRNGGVHFGVKLDMERVKFGGRKERQYVIAFHYRRNRKGQRGEPHAIVLRVLAG